MAKNIIVKSTSEVTFVDGEVKTLTLAEIDQALAACDNMIGTPTDKIEQDIREAEENLAAVVAEIDTKVSEREAELQAQVESDLAFAKDTLNAELQAAYDKYEVSVKSIKDKAEETAKAICEYKESGLAVANKNLDDARNVLDALKVDKVNAASEKESLLELKAIIEAEISRQTTLAQAATSTSETKVSADHPQIIYAASQNKLKF